MEHSFIVIRAAGDLIYLAAALITLIAVLADRTNCRGTDPTDHNSTEQ